MNQPVISILIPVYNRSAFLAEALASAVAQKYRPIEIVVVDDGSEEDLAPILSTIPAVKHVRQEHQGVSVARNTALTHAAGDYISFLDSDDIWEPDKLTVQLNYLETHPEVDLVFTTMANFLEPGSTRPSHLGDDVFDHPQVSIISLLTRRSVFERVGPFDVRYDRGEDTEWLARAKDGGIRCETIQRPLLRRRIHSTNLSHQLSVNRSNALEILRASIRRKRQSAAVADPEKPNHPV